MTAGGFALAMSSEEVSPSVFLKVSRIRQMSLTSYFLSFASHQRLLAPDCALPTPWATLDHLPGSRPLTFPSPLTALLRVSSKAGSDSWNTENVLQLFHSSKPLWGDWSAQGEPS